MTTIASGTRIGPYEVVAAIGAGGMGEVYRARDTRLDRDVAIKMLPPAFAADAERLARFEREAKTLAALNHPNIAQIYGLEVAQGFSPAITALVMELVEGEDLAQRLSRGPIPIEESLKIARQMAAALDAAHERGIIHRDLKPANVKVRDDGTVKVLDFGLAKALAPEGPSAAADVMNSPTITSPATQIGMILGTAAYMAPEQAKGKPVDKRADVWGFGCVLFELLTAKRAFAGSDVSDTLASVLARDVDLTALPAETPPAVRALLRACLQKDRHDRLRDLGDAWLAFDAVEQMQREPASPRARSKAVPWAVAAAGLIAAGMLGVKALGQAPSTSWHLSVALPDGYRVTSGPIISRDRRIVFAAGDGRSQERLFIRDVDAFELRELKGTEGAVRPFFAPDGRHVGYFANGGLFTLDLEGGAATRLADAPSQGGGAWNEDGTIVFVPTWNGGLYRVDARGGEPQLLIKPDPAKKEYAYTSPHFLPGGRELVFSSWGAEFALERLTLQGLGREPIGPGFWGAAVFAASGHLLFPVNQGDVVALPYPPREGVSHTAVLSNVHWRGSSADGVMKFDVSDDGTLVYAPGDSRRSLALVDEHGRASLLPADQQMYTSAVVSPDGTRAAVSLNGAIHIVDLARGTRAPLTLSIRGAQGSEVWTHDGSRLIFGTNSDGNWEIYSAAPGRTGAPQRLLQKDLDQFPMSVAPDGTVLFVEVAAGRGGDLWMLRPDGKTVAWLETSADEGNGRFSPDGSLVAYMSNTSGRSEVYVLPRDGGGTSVRVSANGGDEPAWSRSGDRLFFRQGNLMLAADVRRRPALAVSQPRVLFDGGWALEHDTPFSVMPDGRFLMVRFEPAAIPTRLDIIVNWFDELRRRAPSGSR